MKALTPKQQLFADAYIETKNAAEAARRAGYSQKTAKEMGAENLSKPHISAYINARLQEQIAAGVADADEVMRFYTSVLRGEIKDQFGLDAALSERLKAADALMKRYACAEDRQKATMERLDSLLRDFKDAVNSETN